MQNTNQLMTIHKGYIGQKEVFPSFLVKRRQLNDIHFSGFASTCNNANFILQTLNFEDLAQYREELVIKVFWYFQLVIKVFLFYCRVASPREEKNCRKMSIVEEFQFYYGQGEELTIIGNNEPQTLYT